MAKEVKITKLDTDSFVVHVDNVIVQPFHKSDFKNMLLFINAHIKNLETEREMFPKI
jgi:hypothetical protein